MEMAMVDVGILQNYNSLGDFKGVIQPWPRISKEEGDFKLKSKLDEKEFIVRKAVLEANSSVLKKKISGIPLSHYEGGNKPTIAIRESSTVLEKIIEFMNNQTAKVDNKDEEDFLKCAKKLKVVGLYPPNPQHHQNNEANRRKNALPYPKRHAMTDEHSRSEATRRPSQNALAYFNRQANTGQSFLNETNRRPPQNALAYSNQHTNAEETSMRLANRRRSLSYLNHHANTDESSRSHANRRLPQNALSYQNGHTNTDQLSRSQQRILYPKVARYPQSKTLKTWNRKDDDEGEPSVDGISNGGTGRSTTDTVRMHRNYAQNKDKANVLRDEDNFVKPDIAPSSRKRRFKQKLNMENQTEGDLEMPDTSTRFTGSHDAIEADTENDDDFSNLPPILTEEELNFVAPKSRKRKLEQKSQDAIEDEIDTENYDEQWVIEDKINEDATSEQRPKLLTDEEAKLIPTKTRTRNVTSEQKPITDEEAKLIPIKTRNRKEKSEEAMEDKIDEDVTSEQRPDILTDEEEKSINLKTRKRGGKGQEAMEDKIDENATSEQKPITHEEEKSIPLKPRKRKEKGQEAMEDKVDEDATSKQKPITDEEEKSIPLKTRKGKGKSREAIAEIADENEMVENNTNELSNEDEDEIKTTMTEDEVLDQEDMMTEDDWEELMECIVKKTDTKQTVEESELSSEQEHVGHSPTTKDV